MKLTPQEIETPLWAKIEAEVDSQIDFNRQNNDKSHSLEETQKIRGTIAAYKIIKSWAKADPEIS